ncbi:MAG: hypothetical protein HY688_04665 [Chloroflexi bacterium]|nr:hypothetical protein [Chloroflexota bacterium]
MPPLGLWRLYALLSALLAVGVVMAAAGGALWLALVILMALAAWALVALAIRPRLDEPPPPLPPPPLQEPATLEGRVDRMTIEEAEAPVNTGTPWESTRLATVYVIIISGLRYTVDPGPTRRGRFDWLQEGMWVQATFDRKTRVIYTMRWTPGPGI